MTPPIESRLLVWQQGRAQLHFSGEDVHFTTEPKDQLTLHRGAQTFTASLQHSERNLYPDLKELGTRQVARQRMVFRTRMVSKTVPVTRSRMVTKSVPVMRTRSVTSYGSGSPSYRTETYTEYQTQSVTELYTAYEMQTVWEPYTEWITVFESVVDIPVVDYYAFDWAPGWTLLVYRQPKADGGFDYRFQNPSYLAGHDSAEDAMTGAARIVAIDANSNGVYFENSDRVLFNSWNPYRQDSRYAEVPGFLDNYWYRLTDLERHHLVWASLTADQKTMRIDGPNSRFAGDPRRGRLQLVGLPTSATLTVNGQAFSTHQKSEFEAEVENGVYLVTVAAEGVVDWVETITVDAQHPQVVLKYHPLESAGLLNIENVSLLHWKVIVSDTSGLVAIRQDLKQVSLRPGDYEVTVRSEGYDVRKRITISRDAPARLDYDATVRAQESNRKGT